MSKISDEAIERWAIVFAIGNNGGLWATHYNEDQKNFWRKRAREFIEEFTSSDKD